MEKAHILAGATVPLLLAGLVSMLEPAGAQAACKLGNNIKHVVAVQFDNVHSTRDNPNVPSDLEQMPNLLGFIQSNGTISANHHTPLISHTATDILTTLTGLYGDRMGVPVSNSYRVFDKSGHPSSSHSSFVYWTATDKTDGQPVLLTETGKNAPAPWVAFTRAGCDVGAFSIANLEFETLPGDIGVVYGTTSKEYLDAKAALNLPDTPANAAARQKPNTDWLGISIHCAKGSALCKKGKPDLLPDEPGGYAGFDALYGNINVQPAISSGPIEDLDGNVIADAFGHPGFPNIFDPSATQTLGYLAALLEKGVPVVYGYIEDAHDNHSGQGTFGPGEAGYVAQLKAFDKAFGQFFARLAKDGIDKTNTLFVFLADEGDHFVGGTPTPANCDGVKIPCTYVYPGTTKRSVGELTANLDSLLLTQRGNGTEFLVHADSSPPIYIDTNPAATSSVTRKLERDLAALKWVNPLPGKNNRTDLLAAFLADRAEMKLLHMITSSAARTPSFTMFGNPDYFFQTTKGSLPLAPKNCTADPGLCVFQNNGFAWNHGDVQPEITRTWLGLVGPGVKQIGRNDRVFSDHTDVRPTILLLAGLKDDYVHDGRVLVEKLDPKALPKSLGTEDQRDVFVTLAKLYKQIDAPLGSVGVHSLDFASRSIASSDAAYAAYLATIGSITSERNSLAQEIKTVLDGAAFGNKPLNEAAAGVLVWRAERLIDKVADLVGTSH